MTLIWHALASDTTFSPPFFLNFSFKHRSISKSVYNTQVETSTSKGTLRKNSVKKKSSDTLLKTNRISVFLICAVLLPFSISLHSACLCLTFITWMSQQFGKWGVVEERPSHWPIDMKIIQNMQLWWENYSPFFCFQGSFRVHGIYERGHRCRGNSLQ